MKNKPTFDWLKTPVWATLLTMIAALFSSVTGGFFSLILFGNNDNYGNLEYLFSAFIITVIALSIVYILRKYGNQPWSGLQMSVRWAAVLEIVVGFALAFLTIFISNIISVMLGAAEWKGWDSDISGTIFIVSVIGIILGQAFPEDLFFRGHLFDTLSFKVTPRMDMVITSVAFGSLHFFSQSGADGYGQQLMYVVYAISFGFVLAACRLVKRSLWFPVGFHAGNDQFMDLFIRLEASTYVIHFIIVTICMFLVGFALLRLLKLKS